jgi:serine/threonine-protein kinase
MDDLTTSLPIINNRYQISGTIATGGMAVIYKAQDLMLERPVALKILKKDLSDDLSFQNRFRQEARASARLNHPNIVTTFDFGYDKDRLFIVMEYVKGTELKELMSAEEKVATKDAIDFLQQACRGLAYAHQQGFVHCDIKPQNLLVTDEKVLKITDFGISRALDTVTREEQADVVWGSPYYISPEQSAGKAPSPATDIYALGVVAYELFSGQLPFEAENSAELARMHRMEIPRPLIEVNPQIPDELNRIVMRCLEKGPESRYETAGKLDEALSQVRIPVPASEPQPVKLQVPIQSEMEPEEPETGKPDMATILLALLALVLAGGLIPFWLYVVLSINSINR